MSPNNGSLGSNRGGGRWKRWAMGQQVWNFGALGLGRLGARM